MSLAPVVLIEDSPVFLGLLTAFFERTQPRRFSIAGTARSGEEGLVVVAQCRPVAVLVDLKLPDISGIDVISRLRSQASDLAIVALSSADRDAFYEPVIAAGADGFVSKDRMSTDLLPTLRRAVRARAAIVVPRLFR